MAPLVEVKGLNIFARGQDGGDIPIVRNVAFAVDKGQVLGLIGESGSGKTTLALAVMGFTRPGCRIESGSVRLGGVEITSMTATELRSLRGRRVAYIAQSAAAAFNPARPLMAQVIETALIHGTMTRAEARAKALGLFEALAIPDPVKIAERYPHQVSGGQLQRVMAAMALINDPEVVIFDEPTTALDVTTQIEVLKAFKSAIRDRATTGLYVTHDLAVIAQIADRILVLKNGEIQETADTARLVEGAESPYTRSLIAAAEPVRRTSVMPQAGAQPLLSVSGLSAGYGGLTRAGRPRLPVLYDLSVKIARGQALGVIGESGSGKSTLARVIAGLSPPASGSISYDGRALPALVRNRSRDDLRRIQIVFQSADTSLNPRVQVSEIIGRPLQFYRGLRGEARKKRVRDLLDLTRLPASVYDRRPQDLSGGQKQRVSLARALAAEPELLLCDEVTSALDTVVAAAILDLLADLRRELGLAYMFISHDIKVIRAICDDVMVLYAGRQVESLPAARVDEGVHHPYTRLLLSSVPHLDPGWLERTKPLVRHDAGGLPAGSQGCPFYARCPVRIATTCPSRMPSLEPVASGGTLACFQTPDILSCEAPPGPVSSKA